MEHVRKDKALDYFLRKIREQSGGHLKQIILFGSRARGDNVQDSDYDCLVVVDEVSRSIKDIVDEAAGETLYQYNAVVSALVISEEKYRQQTYSPLLMNIAKEGVAL
jgi:predicted nucleotidyltransferase